MYKIIFNIDNFPNGIDKIEMNLRNLKYIVKHYTLRELEFTLNRHQYNINDDNGVEKLMGLMVRHRKGFTGLYCLCGNNLYSNNHCSLCCMDPSCVHLEDEETETDTSEFTDDDEGEDEI
jgi:hypothetical protein